MFHLEGNRSYDWAKVAVADAPGWWVHWRYNEAEWRPCAERAWARARTAYRRATSIALLIAGLFMLGLIGVRLADIRVPGLLAAFVTPGLLLLLMYWHINVRRPYTEAKAAYQQRSQGPLEIAINPLWLWEAGRARPLIRRYHELTGLRLDGRDGIVMLVFEMHELTSRGAGAYSVTVLVPAGQADAARQLIARCQGEILERVAHPAPRLRRPDQPGRPLDPGVGAPAPGHGPAITIKFPRRLTAEQALPQTIEQVNADGSAIPVALREETEQLG